MEPSSGDSSRSSSVTVAIEPIREKKDDVVLVEFLPGDKSNPLEWSGKAFSCALELCADEL